MKAERVVLDTNVLISAALIPQSVPASVVRHVLTNCQIVFSEHTFRELETRLWRSKFDRYLSIETRKSLLHDFSAVAHWVTPEPSDHNFKRWSADPDDDKFVEAAIAADATWLVSGARDLLEIASVMSSFEILSPSEALAHIAALAAVR